MKKNKIVRKLSRTGGDWSFSVVIPKEHVEALGWHEKQKLIVKRIPRGVAIIDAITKKRKKKSKWN